MKRTDDEESSVVKFNGDLGRVGGRGHSLCRGAPGCGAMGGSLDSGE